MVRAARGSNRNRKNNRNGDSMYHGSFAGDRQTFINGNAAPDDFWSETSQEEAHRSKADLRMVARRSREHAIQMNLRYAMFLAFLVTVLTLCLVGYIKLKADISDTNKQISSLESQLNELRASNNEVYNEIVGNVDLEEIRRIAIDEFGMKYANQDQIVVYSETKGDLVHQVADLDN